MKRAIVVVYLWAASFCLVAVYLAIGWGIDDIVDHSAWSTQWIGVLGALGLGVFAWVVNVLGAAQMNQMEPTLCRSMIRQVFVLGLSQRTNERAGRVANPVTDDIECAAVYKGIFLAPMIASLTTPILVAIVVALAIDPVVGGFLAIATPLVPICVMGFHKAFRPVSSRYRHAPRQLAVKEFDAIQGPGDLALISVGKDTSKCLAEVAEEVRSKVMNYLAGNQLILLVIDPVFSLSIIADAITLALIRYQQGMVSVGEGISLVLLSLTTFDPLDHIGQFSYISMGGIVANKEIMKFIRQTPPVVGAKGVKVSAIPPQHGEIRPSGMFFPYAEDTPVLQGVNLILTQGEYAALAGPSGAGKPTISALLQGFLRPARGCVSLNSVDPATVPLSWVRVQTAVVEQNTYLFSGTLCDNLLLASPAATGDQLIEAPRAVYLGEFVDTPPGSLDARVGARGLAVSGGEAQRIVITRAFLENAPIMILDEPTIHVDLASEREILTSLETVRVGRTTLTISHRDVTVKSSDRVTTLQEGTIQ